jgi:hypothetical protein
MCVLTVPRAASTHCKRHRQVVAVGALERLGTWRVSAATRTHPGIALDYHTSEPPEVSGNCQCPRDSGRRRLRGLLLMCAAGEARNERGRVRFFIDIERRSYGRILFQWLLQLGGAWTPEYGCNSPALSNLLSMFVKRDPDKVGENVRGLLNQRRVGAAALLRSVDQDLFDSAVRK